MTELSNPIGDWETCLQRASRGDPHAWEVVFNEALSQLRSDNAEVWKKLIQFVLEEERKTHGKGVLKSRLMKSVVGGSPMESHVTGLELLVSACLEQIRKGVQLLGESFRTLPIIC